MDSERQIEKLLRDCAKRRRDAAGAPLELHPATRRLLHSEVARRAPKPRASFWRELLSGLKPRVAIAACLVAAVLAATWLLLPPAQPDLHLAHVDQLEIRPTSEMAAPSVTAPPVLDELKKSKARDLMDTPAEVATAGTAAETLATRRTGGMETPASKPVDTAETLNGRSAIASFGLEARERIAESPTAAAPGSVNLGAFSTPAQAPSTASPEFDVQWKGEAAALADRMPATPAAAAREPQDVPSQFARSAPARPAPSARQTFKGVPPTVAYRRAESVSPSLVLTSFDVEQQGRELRVIDQDGSVYLGYLQIEEIAGQPIADDKQTAARKLGMPEDSQRSRAIADSSSVSVKNVSFRVSGTNLSLNQNVVFVGDLLAESPSAGGGATNTVRDAVGGFLVAPSQPADLLRNSRISGRATINEREEIEINAVPVKP